MSMSMMTFWLFTWNCFHTAQLMLSFNLYFTLNFTGKLNFKASIYRDCVSMKCTIHSQATSFQNGHRFLFHNWNYSCKRIFLIDRWIESCFNTVNTIKTVDGISCYGFLYICGYIFWYIEINKQKKMLVNLC